MIFCGPDDHREVRQMAEVRVHLNNDGLGGSRWWAESDGFSAAADGIDDLLELIRSWAVEQGLDDYRMTLVEDTLEDDEAGTVDTLPARITARAQ